MMRGIWIALICCSAMFLAGCGAAKPMTPGEVWGFCMDSGGSDESCSGKRAICDGYKEVLAKDYATAKDCREACYGVRHDIQARNPGLSCGDVYDGAEGYCTSACNARFENR